jgi:hypothetical protein
MALEAPEIPVVKVDNRIKYGVIAALIVVAIIPSVYFYLQYRTAQQRLTNPSIFAAEEAKKYTAMVGKLMTLPTDEVPTLATVNDKEKLKNQPFFVNTENGDKVLIYTNAKKAILYRPSINKIIDVAPINIGATATASAETAPAAATVKFTLRNGTSIVGLTKTFETQLKAKVANEEVLDRDNAKRKDYANSILVDIKGTKSAQAAQIAADLGLTVAPIPVDESTPSGDFLVILGTDKK